jgi:hypothetical protein
MRESGKLVVTAEALWCDGGPDGSWRLPVSDIAVVGEYTNANGPWIDDYYLVFVHRDRTCFEASFYASGRDRALDDLGVALGGADLSPGLCNSAEWKTRVLWPSQLADSPLWVLKREALNRESGGAFSMSSDWVSRRPCSLHRWRSFFPARERANLDYSPRENGSTCAIVMAA